MTAVKSNALSNSDFGKPPQAASSFGRRLQRTVKPQKLKSPAVITGVISLSVHDSLIKNRNALYEVGHFTAQTRDQAQNYAAIAKFKNSTFLHNLSRDNNISQFGREEVAKQIAGMIDEGKNLSVATHNLHSGKIATGLETISSLSKVAKFVGRGATAIALVTSGASLISAYKKDGNRPGINFGRTTAELSGSLAGAYAGTMASNLLVGSWVGAMAAAPGAAAAAATTATLATASAAATGTAATTVATATAVGALASAPLLVTGLAICATIAGGYLGVKGATYIFNRYTHSTG